MPPRVFLRPWRCSIKLTVFTESCMIGTIACDSAGDDDVDAALTDEDREGVLLPVGVECWWLVWEAEACSVASWFAGLSSVSLWASLDEASGPVGANSATGVATRRTASRYPVLDHDASHSDLHGASPGRESLATSSGPNRDKRQLRSTLRIMPWATITMAPWAACDVAWPITGTRTVSMKRSALIFIESRDSDGIKSAVDDAAAALSLPRVPKRLPSSDPKSFSLSSSAWTTPMLLFPPVARDWLSATAWAVLTARWRFEA